MHFRYWVIALFAVTIALAYLIIHYTTLINSFFQYPSSANILLLILIIVDLMTGVFSSVIERWIKDTRQRNKLLTEECIAKLEFNYSDDDDEHILTVANEKGERTKPPYYQEMKAHLENYTNLWKLIQELPKEYRKTKKEQELLINDIAKELEDFSTTQNLSFPYQTKNDAISKLAKEIYRDLFETSIHYKVTYDKIGSEAHISGTMVNIPEETANKIAEKMDELKANSAYIERSKAMQNSYSIIQQKAGEFHKQRDAIVEEVRISGYKNLKEKPWYKRF